MTTVGLIGTGFMGKCHTNAYKTIPYIYTEAGFIPRLTVLCDQNEKIVEEQAGSGTTLDVARDIGRRALGADGRFRGVCPAG